MIAQMKVVCSAEVYRDHSAERVSRSDEECWMARIEDGSIHGPWQTKGAAMAGLVVERRRIIAKLAKKEARR
jgi:hypothetical protein